MLDKVDLDKKLKRKEWHEQRGPLQRHLYDLARALRDEGIPAIVVFEGWDAAGKGTSIRQLTAPLDPRGFKVWPIRPARTFERNHPWLWRFWLKVPARGEIAVFDRSWYGRVLGERVDGLVTEAQWTEAYHDIVDFEHQLADDGCVIVKLWLQISKAEQARRFKLLEKSARHSWKVQTEDWEHHWRYKDYLRAADDMLQQTESEWGRWTIVEANDQKYAWSKVLSTTSQALGTALRARGVDPDALGPNGSAQPTPEAAPAEMVEAAQSTPEAAAAETLDPSLSAPANAAKSAPADGGAIPAGNPVQGADGDSAAPASAGEGI